MPRLEDVAGEAVNPLSGRRSRLSLATVWEYLTGGTLVVLSLAVGSAVIGALSRLVGGRLSVANLEGLVTGKAATPAKTQTATSSANGGFYQ